jgi:type IV secretion system protein VirB8
VANKLFTKKGESSETKNWYADRFQSVLVQRNLLAIVSLLALSFALVAIFLVWRNIPIVTVEPFVIQVEPKSGVTQVVDPRTTVQLTGDQAINNYFVVRYIRAHETFDSNIATHFETVRIMSEPRTVFTAYAWTADPRNPDSFLAKPGSSQSIEINSISWPPSNPASCVNARCVVTVYATRKIVGAQGGATEEKVIINMAFTYTEIDLTIDERYINPLGFRVIEYRVDKEYRPQ